MDIFRYILVLTALCCSITNIHAADKRVRVYGSPGVGHIQVRVVGDFLHPGIYWLPTDTKLPQLLEEAKLTLHRKGEFDTPPIILIIRQRNGQTEKTRFWLPQLPTKGRNFKLQHDDLVRTDYILF